MKKSPILEVPTAFEQLDPDHLLSRIEIQQCFNKLQYDHTITAHAKELIQEHMAKVERDGLKIFTEVEEEGSNG